MKKLIFTLIILFLFTKVYSQAPEIEWQNTIGGNSDDFITSTQQTSDDGYILGGYSISAASGDKTEGSLFGSNDYWVVKLNASGTILWQNTIGGSANDALHSLKQTSDGGYILGGSSYSGISGDKNESNLGGSDYWIIKLNSSGNIVWQNTIGGDLDDILVSIDQTMDGGYIIGGNSYSGITGDKTESNTGANDYWVIKINSTGSIIWQNTIGGWSDDILTDIHPTAEGGYFLGGYSWSELSGDKTENNISPEGPDFWVVKLNASGGIEWDNTIGGFDYEVLQSVQQTTDGGYIIGGRSNSDISGDKTENNMGPIHVSDYWILKLNSFGDITWQNTIGGISEDQLYSVQQTFDGGYILAGYSISGISGDKTQPNKGEYDFWIVKLNGTGSIIWDKTIGGNSIDRLFNIEQSDELGYIMSGWSISGLSGDKTENNIGGYDYWIIKLNTDVCIPLSETCNTFDDNCNGLIDDGVTETITISAGGLTTFCSGGSVILDATYSGTSLQWKKNGANIPGATSSIYSATTTGTYSAQTSSDCDTELSNEIFVQVNKKPNAFIYADGPTAFCAGGSVTLIANAGGGLSYQWYKGASPIAGATNINYVATTTGNYKCLVTKTISGCNKQSNAIAVAVTCKEENELIENDRFIIYPNPSSEAITISLASAPLITHYSLLILTDLSGKIISEINVSSAETEIDISNYPSGIYFINLISGNNSFTEKFIKI